VYGRLITGALQQNAVQLGVELGLAGLRLRCLGPVFGPLPSAILTMDLARRKGQEMVSSRDKKLRAAVILGFLYVRKVSWVLGSPKSGFF
jgi:hypothetical protein